MEKRLEPNAQKKRWTEYIDELYDKENKEENIEIEREDDSNVKVIEPYVLDSQIWISVKKLKKRTMMLPSLTGGLGKKPSGYSGVTFPSHMNDSH